MVTIMLPLFNENKRRVTACSAVFVSPLRCIFLVGDSLVRQMLLINARESSERLNQYAFTCGANNGQRFCEGTFQKGTFLEESSEKVGLAGIAHPDI